MILFAEESTGWLIAAITTLVGTVSSIYAIISKIRKDKAESKKDETTYLFGQYQELVTKLKLEHESDRQKLSQMQNEHLHCREELASIKSELILIKSKLDKQNE